MRIEPYSRHGDLRFVVHAETEADRAILGFFVSEKFRQGRELGIGGHTYSCDVSAVTDFNFGWHEPYPKQNARKRK